MTHGPGGLPEQTVHRVLDTCLGVRRGEVVSLLVDDGTDPAVVAGLQAGLDARDVRAVLVPVVCGLPGSEPGGPLAEALLAGTAAIELTSTFIGSSQARRDANAAGVRYLCMPGVRASTFRPGGPLDVDFDALVASTRAVAAAWEAADTFRLTSPAGTDLRGSVRGRAGRALTGVAREPGAYMCPPDVEAGTAPVEGSADGTVVIDADLLFMGDGPLREPVVLEFRAGLLVGAQGAQVGRLTEVLERCDDPRMANLAEVSLGLNPRGAVGPVAMETESTLGTAHIALGNSIAYGGVVAARAHLDCVLRDATLLLDGRPVPVVEDLLAASTPSSDTSRRQP